MFKGALFDMDGLMIDTERVSAKCWIETARIFDINMKEEEITALITRFRGKNMIAAAGLFAELFHDAVSFKEFIAKKYEIMDKELEGEGLRKKEGLDELLEFLKSEGIKMAVATSTVRSRAESYLNRLGILQYFNRLVCGDEVKNSKPAPDIYITAAASLGLKPEECIGLEDSIAGIRALSAAGCFTVAVPDMDELDPETASLCNAVCQNLKEVIPIVKAY